MTEGLIDTFALKCWLREFAKMIFDGRDTLSQLDAAAGDADHGANMERGMRAALKVLDAGDVNATPTDVLKAVGVAVVNSVGGSSGALYGTIFLRMARSVNGWSEFGADEFAKALRAGLEGVVERGSAKLGDKTMYDAFGPAVEALEEGLGNGLSLCEALRKARMAADAGRDATARMTARRGKASYLGEKSLGSQDPGATSIAILIAAADAALCDEQCGGDGKGYA